MRKNVFLSATITVRVFDHLLTRPSYYLPYGKDKYFFADKNILTIDFLKTRVESLFGDYFNDNTAQKRAANGNS